MRTLATIQRIQSLNSIPNADLIKVARVLGWNVVIRNGEFSVGDLGVYCETDSIMPEHEAFEFLKDRGYRIKIIKLKGQVSQGILFPISILKDFGYDGPIDEGCDVTDIIGIVKYEPYIPEQLRGVTEGYYPGYLPKSDETRIQSIPDIIDMFKGVPFYVSEKLDGTSFSAFLSPHDQTFHVGSRNMLLKMSDINTYWKIAKKYDIEKSLVDYYSKTGITLAIQGEIIGSGIQGNKYNFKQNDIRLYVFNIINTSTKEYLPYDEFMSATRDLGLTTVPIIYNNFSWSNEQTVDSFINMANGKSIINTGAYREGLVFRSLTEICDIAVSEKTTLRRLSFKAISEKFLLKHQDE